MLQIHRFAFWASAFILACCLLFSGCSGCSGGESQLPPVASGSVIFTPDSSIPNDIEPDIRGYITRIKHSPESTELLVEFLGDPCEYQYAYTTAKITVDEKTALASVSGGEISFAVGQTVEVWTDGAGASTPVVAYGQAVLIDDFAKPVCGISIIDQLTVGTSGGSAHLAVTQSALWRGIPYTFGLSKELFGSTLGSHIAVAAGDCVSLSFDNQPDSVKVFAYSSSDTSEIVCEPAVENGKFTVPEGFDERIYTVVEANWGENSAVYLFVIVIVS